jgi:hypothetical protein
MAGEWIAMDVGLPDKPEVQELLDLTGESVEAVVFRLYRLWGWAALHCSDGTARMTIPRLVRTCGADEAFWRAVAAVGWLEIDEDGGTVAVPGWDRRFSQAAKARIQHQDRAKAQNERDPDRRKRPEAACAQAQESPAPTRSRGDRGDRGEVPPPPRASFADLRKAWNDGPGQKWKPNKPPDGAEDRLNDPEWWPMALEAIQRLRTAKYFDTPPTLMQFVAEGFVERTLGGQYDAGKTSPRPPGGRGRPDDRPEAKPFVGKDADDFEYTRRRELERLAQAKAVN